MQWCATHATSQLWVSVDGAPVIERCFGDTRASDAADVGSIQKNVICLAIAVLVGRGEIDIDQPMTTWLGRGWTQSTPAQEDAVTLRHVMSMTTGLFEDLTFEADPGRVWTYNNHAYHLVKKALAELTGQTTQQLCDELIFGPLGMADSTWRDRDGDVLAGGWPVSALHTSARDLTRFGEAMLDRGNCRRRRRRLPRRGDAHVAGPERVVGVVLVGLLRAERDRARPSPRRHRRPAQTARAASRSTGGSRPTPHSTRSAASASAISAST